MSRPAARRPAFTLIELLVVMGIIAILIVVAVGVAAKVSGSGKARATEQVERVLDTALDAYIQAKGAPPAPWVLDPRSNNTGNQPFVQPVADARNMDSGTEIINSVGLFILQCKEVPAADAALKQLDAKVFHQYNPENSESPTLLGHQPTLLTAFDGWGNPIRYVHPQFKGLVLQTPNDPTTGVMTTTVLPQPPGKQFAIANIRRNAGDPNGIAKPDSDGGLNQSNRPYFYSCGPDGDPSTTDDNIYYPSQPRLQKHQ
jgi:prepilin-type N-terminal cleavage/methylation domain-containing protein